ncbi:uncharacterized protein ACRADG_005464 [Cochliomyia hominivorax]
MSSHSNEENKPQNDDTSNNETNDSTVASEGVDKKILTFKDWKNLKESEQKSDDKFARGKQRRNRNINQNNRNNNDFDRPNGFGGHGGGNFYAGNNRMQGCNNFNFPMGGNNFGFGLNQNGFGLNRNNFGFNNFNGPNNFGGNNNGFNRSNCVPNVNLPDNFFATDGIFRQKDLMQKPLPPGANPFRDDRKAEKLLKEFDKSRYSKDDKKKKKKKGNKKPTNETKKSGEDVVKNTEPKIYIPNPKAKIDGKPFIPKPKIPEENLEISKEEKKQQWKEYREAMKPFKNREFYNAKRVVQRLGKLPPSELDEKQLLRLTNAREIMAAHKARLTIKYGGSYVKAADNSNELGELYVLEKKPVRAHHYPHPAMAKGYQNFGNFGDTYGKEEYESGRKILGGYSRYPGFVSGGVIDSTTGAAAIN